MSRSANCALSSLARWTRGRLADVEHRLSVGTSEKLQLGGLVGIFMQVRAALAA